MKITFDDSAKLFVLGAFDKMIDSETYIVEKDNPKQRVLTRRGEEIKLDEFAGVFKNKDGSVSFIKSDIVSLIEASDCYGQINEGFNFFKIYTT